MSDETKDETTKDIKEEIMKEEIMRGALEKVVNTPSVEAVAKSVYSQRKRAGKPQRGRGGKRDENSDDLDQQIIDIARVTRVMAGGKRMRFRACVAIGNKKGEVGIGMAKGADVSLAVNKAVNKARKNIIKVPIIRDTIPHEITYKYGAAKILLKPASRGRGVIAGGAVRTILELAGVKNVTSKILGTNNKVNNVKCAIEALKRLKKVENKESNKQKIQPEILN